MNRAAWLRQKRVEHLPTPPPRVVDPALCPPGPPHVNCRCIVIDDDHELVVAEAVWDAFNVPPQLREV